MPPPRIVTDYAGRLNELVKLPSVVTWTRLEPLSLTTGDLLPGLRAPIADPLWLMTRQWQFAELRGEDGGSPVRVDVAGEHAVLDRFHPRRLPANAAAAAAEATDMADVTVPLEVAVEAEIPPVLPERVRAEGGLHLLRMLARLGIASLREEVVAGFAFAAAPADADDPIGTERHRLLADRVPDAARVVAALEAVTDATGVVTVPPAPIAAHAQPDAIAATLTEWRRWFAGYLAGPGGPSSWDPHRLDYGFAVSATLNAGPAVLRADEYASGTLDWYSFDAAGAPSLGSPQQAAVSGKIAETVLPTPVRYAGMPSDRLWGFEEADVYLGGLDAGPTDLARLALVEFSLVYGTDWFVVPINLPAGSVARLDSVTVHDTFSERIAVPPGRQAQRPGWVMFHLPAYNDNGYLADLFVLPPTLRHALESPPLEEVALFRDEMANLVWAVERIVQGPTGERVPWSQLAGRVSLRQQLPGDLGDAKIVYRLMTPVPANWIPFVASPVTDASGQRVPVPNQPTDTFVVDLERRPMVRFLENGDVEVTDPRGVLLRSDPSGDVTRDRLRIAEEEVPRDGIVVTRSYQLARTEDGSTVLWIGRKKSAGRGEGASGLRFDTAVPPAT